MDFSAIQVNAMQSTKKAIEVIVQTTLWAGHRIKVGFLDNLAPTLRALWSSTLSSLRTINNLIKTGPEMTFAIATGLFIAGIAAFKIADHKAYEEDMVSKTAWKALGITAFVSATIITSFGIAAILI